MDKLNIENFKQELKLIIDEKCRDHYWLANLLSLNNIPKLKENHYYLRAGLFFYIDFFVENNKEQLKLMYEVLRKQKLALITKIDNVKNREFVEVKDLNEKTFAQIMMQKNFAFKRLIVTNLDTSDTKAFNEIFYKKGMDVINLDELRKNEKIQNRKITSFSSYKSFNKKDILQEIGFVQSNISYLEKLKEVSKQYENSLIKRIFNSDEDKMAYFITGAITPLQDTGIDPLSIITTYKNRGIDFDLLDRNIRSFEHDNEYDELFFYIKYIYKDMLIEQNQILATDLNSYLMKIDWTEEKNKGFNFTLLEMYVVLPKLMTSIKDYGLLTNYVKVIENYLISKPKEERINEFYTIFIDLNIGSIINKISIKKSMIDLMDKLEISSRDLDSYLWGKISFDDKTVKKSKSTKTIKALNYIREILASESYIKYITLENENLVLNTFELSMDLELDLKIMEQNLKNMTNLDNEKISIPLSNFQFKGENLKRGMLEFLLKKDIKDIDEDMDFNAFWHEKELKNKISEISKEETSRGKKKL